MRERADERLVTCERNDFVGLGTTENVAGAARSPLDENFLHVADVGTIDLGLDAAVQLDEASESRLREILVNEVACRETRSGRAITERVLVEECVVEANRAHEIERSLVVRIGLAGESHDDIRGQR